LTPVSADEGYKEIKLDPSYEHDKWVTLPKDQVFKFAAYTTSFDGPDDNDGDGLADYWGIPEWVAFEIKKSTTDHPLEVRPKWMTDESLYNQGIAPNDSTYHVKGTKLLKEVKGSYRYVRGHMCPKNTAERISADAAYNTHTILNACPQLQWQNNGIWKKLEKQSLDWADKYGRIWVVCGPVFFGKKPSVWLGQSGEKQAAIPDAFFKIIVKRDGNKLDTLTFLIPNVIPKNDNEITKFLVTVDRIELLTGLDFLSAIDDELEEEIESRSISNISW